MSTSMPHILENHMTLGDYSQDVPEPDHTCFHCGEAIASIDDGKCITVLVPNPNWPRKPVRYLRRHFCDNACRSEGLYAAASASGKADLERLVAALHLISEVEVLHRAPMAEYEFEEFGPAENPSDMITYEDFRERAMQLLAILSPAYPATNQAEWTERPRDLADTLALALGKAV